MKKMTSIKILTLLFSVVLIFVGATTNFSKTSNVNMNIVVLVKYKALENKANTAIIEMTKLINSVKKEPHFIKIKILLDPKDSTNIMLFEEWDNAEYYTGAHMQTEHLQKYILDSRSFFSRTT
ncbi:MAG: antibiotic biosynthesis monooxygenase [Saprospiraceae bacterium]|nr:antibiotic biosynthesis monooxygenase [Saprospiraceae bacterium]